jgi:hypothetical protein
VPHSNLEQAMEMAAAASLTMHQPRWLGDGAPEEAEAG